MDHGKSGAHEIMENNTEFDLTKSLGDWRRRATDVPALSEQNLRELEAHLKDSIAKLQNCGLSQEESFQIATRRLGSIETLGAEFGKVNAERVWLDRALWIVAGLQVYLFVSSITGLAVRIMMPVVQSLWFKMISREMAYSLQGRPFDAVIDPIVYWLLFAAVVWRVWKSISQGGLDISRWTKLASRNLWLLGGSLTLAGLLLSFGGVITQQFIHKLISTGNSTRHVSFGFTWQYYLSVIPHAASVPLALVWILRERRINESFQETRS
jgi:hypothetical protein